MAYTEDISSVIAQASQELSQINIARPEAVSRPGLKEQIVRFLTLIRSAMYPKIFGSDLNDPKRMKMTISSNLQQAAVLLNEMIEDVLRGEGDADGLTAQFIGSIVDITNVLETDIKAAYDGDPAARSEEEIMLAYPAVEAISIFRLAHKLYELKVPLLPRMMTEYAHKITGIDIHPGATIGEYFFIDHGTGVVIGETCTIGRHVKLYQGVTLGAKSFETDENGNPVKGIKRHPDIGNHVVIYAGATILGGKTRIGDNCVIGGNVWLTHSVGEGETVYYNKGDTN